MPRLATLRRYRGYWFSQAGSRQGTYFGRIDEVPYQEAKRRFGEFLAGQKHDRQQEFPSHSVAEICNAHLHFVQNNRSDALYKQRKCILNGFCNYQIGQCNDETLIGCGHLIGQLRARSITRAHVEAYLHYRRTTSSKMTGKPLGDKGLRHIVVAVKACWNWAASSIDDGGGGLLPDEPRPLSKLPRGFVQPKDLSEADLPTAKEIDVLFHWALVDPGKIPAGTDRASIDVPDDYCTADSRTFADMLRAYYATGARTSELCAAQVRDFMPRTRQICLGNHKRLRTQHNPTIRNIQVDEDLLAILLRHSHGKQLSEPLFMHPNGRAWNQNEVNARLRAVKSLAADHGQHVRKDVTPYSFRDLYISELLMLGIEPFKVAKMAGTSLKELDRCYGHFFNHDLAAAQQRLNTSRNSMPGQVHTPALLTRGVAT